MLFIYLIPVKRNFTLFELNDLCFWGPAAAFAAVVFLMPSVPETVHNRQNGYYFFHLYFSFRGLYSLRRLLQWFCLQNNKGGFVKSPTSALRFILLGCDSRLLVV